MDRACLCRPLTSRIATAWEWRPSIARSLCVFEISYKFAFFTRWFFFFNAGNFFFFLIDNNVCVKPTSFGGQLWL